MQKSRMKKVVKSKVAAQKWLWWFDYGKIFNNNNLCRHGPHPFLQFGCFCVDFIPFCNLTNLCFVAGG